MSGKQSSQKPVQSESVKNGQVQITTEGNDIAPFKLENPKTTWKVKHCDEMNIPIAKVKKSSEERGHKTFTNNLRK